MLDDIERLKLAVSYVAVRDIMQADETIQPDERAFLMLYFPFKKLADAELVDEQGELLEGVRQWVDESRERFAALVPPSERTAIFDQLISAVSVDGELNAGEAEALRRGAALLGLTDAEVDARLDAHPSVGEVELDETGTS